MPETLKNKILTQIYQQKPHSRQHFLLINTFKTITVFILFCLSSLVLSYFIWDLIQAAALLNQTEQNFLTILANSLPELLFFVLIASLVLYLLYRQTDLPLVKNRALVFATVWFILAIISGGLFWAIRENSTFEDEFIKTQNQLENLPYRSKRFNGMYQKGRKPDLFVGRIVKLSVENAVELKIVVKNRFEQLELIVNQTQVLNTLSIGQEIAIRFDPKKPGSIIEIKLAQPKLFGLFRQPLRS